MSSRFSRHVLFLKSDDPDGPSYFVMRDTFPGNPRTDPSWWTWLNLGEADMIEVDGKPLDAKQTPHDKNPDLAKLPTVSGRSVEMKTAFGAGTRVWFANASPLTCRARLTFTAGILMVYPKGLPKLDFSKYLKDKKETKTIFEASARLGEDYFYVLYPHKTDEPVAKFERLADGCLRITTPESTDYVFVSDTPLAFDRDGVTFTGKAGAVRVFKNRVALCMNGGTGRVGYKGAVLEGSGPFERVIRLAALKPGVTQVPGTYEKKYLTVDIGRGITVRGEGPFEAKLDGETLRINTHGRRRILNVTRPVFILRPQYWIDGQQWMACWTDWPDSGFGRWSHTNLMALTVPDGDHELVVKNMVFPPVWDREFTPLIPGVVKPK